MKYIFLVSLFLICTLTSCDKEGNSAKCYTCTYGQPGPTQTRDVCTNRIDTVQFTDAQGNNLQSICVPK
jgi:hypothetical protein